jgi:hypothetical protein
MSDSEDETKSETSETSDISEYPDDIEEDTIEQRVYTDLLIEKYRLIISFIDGITEPTAYQIALATLNKQLRESFDENVERDILDKELELNQILEEFEQKINEYLENYLVARKEYAFRSELVKDIFTESQLNDLKVTRYQLDELIEKYNPQEEETLFKLQDLSNEWKSMSPQEKSDIEKLTHLRYPIKSSFATLEQYERAK